MNEKVAIPTLADGKTIEIKSYNNDENVIKVRQKIN